VPLTAQYGPLERHQIDIYPAKRRDGAPAPVLVYIYGGGWDSGRRTLYRFLGRSYAAKGYTVAIPDYRLYPEARFPDFVEDAALALRWVTDNIAAHGGDPDRLHLMGHSAGAHIGALICLDDRFLGAVALAPSNLASFTGVAGPYSFNPLEYDSTRPIFAHLEDIDIARPIKHVRGDAPPMLLLHSRPDKTVPIHNSEFMHAAVGQAGGRADYIAYPFVGHVGIILSIAPPARLMAPVLRDSLAFMGAVETGKAGASPTSDAVFA